MRQKIRWVLNVWRPIRGWFFVLLLLTGISTAVAIAYPLVLRRVLDTLQAALSQGATDAEARMRTAVLLLIAVAVGRLFANLYPAARAYLNARIERNVRETYFAVLLRKGYRFFLRFRTGDLVTRLTDDISEFPRIAWFCCSGIFRALDSGSKFFFCLAVMLWMEWRLAVLAVAPLPLMTLLFLAVQRSLRRRTEAQREAISQTNDLLEASFSGVRIIKAFNAEGRQSEALRRQLEDRVELEMAVVRMQQLIHNLYASFNVVGQIIVIGFGGVLVARGEITAGTFYAFYAYLGMLANPLLDLPNLFVAGRQAFVSIDRVEELRLTDVAEEGGALRGSARVERFESLELRDVRFAYSTGAALEPAAREVLQGVDLQLRRGQRLAVVGRLGSGKSSLLRIVAGSLVPTQGEVRLNGRRLDAYEPRSFGAHVGVVQQEPLLLRGTIRENVVFGRPEDPDLLAAVIEAVGLKREIDAFPQGLDSEVGQRGLTLSGGQRQRLTIARALYGRPRLLLLDDLTSALDAENEDRLWRALDLLTPDVTILVVTHRIATARAMGRIVVLEAGRIAAAGSHEELLGSSQLYREFQQAGAEPLASVAS